MEELKRKFIVSENLDEEKIKDFVERLLPFCKLSSDGNVLIDKKITTNMKKMKTALVGRYLANHLEPSIPAEMNSDEIANILSIPKDQVYARIKDLKDEKFIVELEKKKFRVHPFEIGKFIGELETEFKQVSK